MKLQFFLNIRFYVEPSFFYNVIMPISVLWNNLDDKEVISKIYELWKIINSYKSDLTLTKNLIIKQKFTVVSLENAKNEIDSLNDKILYVFCYCKLISNSDLGLKIGQKLSSNLFYELNNIKSLIEYAIEKTKDLNAIKDSLFHIFDAVLCLDRVIFLWFIFLKKVKSIFYDYQELPPGHDTKVLIERSKNLLIIDKVHTKTGFNSKYVEIKEKEWEKYNMGTLGDISQNLESIYGKFTDYLTYVKLSLSHNLNEIEVSKKELFILTKKEEKIIKSGYAISCDKNPVPIFLQLHNDCLICTLLLK
jgi:hypothetical protein